MPSACVAQQGPIVAATSQLIASGQLRAHEAFRAITEACAIADPTRLTDEALYRMVDQKILCDVMCCCRENPSTGSSGTGDYKQVCVDETLSAADTALQYRSRYKPEVSYNMDTNPPSPFMHRDAGGRDTTQRSTYWQGRAQAEIEGYQGGQGQVRRPDVVIVRDPNQPPYQDNIQHVVEMKFRGDQIDRGQDRAYERIAGDPTRYATMREGQECRCGERRRMREVLEPYVVVQRQPSREQERRFNLGAAARTAGWGILTALGAVATVAAVVSPFEGPAGDIVAGAGTAAAAARTATAAQQIYAAAQAAGVAVTATGTMIAGSQAVNAAGQIFAGSW